MPSTFPTWTPCTARSPARSNAATCNCSARSGQPATSRWARCDGSSRRSSTDTALAGTLLDQVRPESPDNSVATVASCIGVALGLLDDWLSGGAGDAPTRLGQHTCLPAGHWTGERAATDIVALARKGRAFRSLDKLLTRQGGPQVLAGSALALAAATRAWSQLSDSPPADLIRTIIR